MDHGWNCPRCGESNEDDFALCWQCGTGRDGTPAGPAFRADEASGWNNRPSRSVSRGKARKASGKASRAKSAKGRSAKSGKAAKSSSAKASGKKSAAKASSAKKSSGKAAARKSAKAKKVKR